MNVPAQALNLHDADQRMSRSSGPPPAVIENAMERWRPRMALSSIVAMSCGILVFVVSLALLLFV